MSARQRAVQLVRLGRSFSEAAEQCGDPNMTRDMVAGLCRRAGVKAPLTDAKIERWGDRISASNSAAWARRRASA